ncbi:MAG: HD domain-containing phosphohydrolase [Burkholderiaceae bacterium]|nr:HD domain-containing phosphohydrolase [Burkholderiaceae bacterium]
MSDHIQESTATAHSAEPCVLCGSHSAERLYTRLAGTCTCEHCLLECRKQLMGMGEEMQELLVESLTAALDMREHETGLHSKRVACHTLVLARHCYSDPALLKQVYWGSLLHDVGKIGVPDAILLKSDPLTEADWEIMRRHPGAGYDMLSQIPFFETVANIILCHEERFDGSGYPQGLSGDAIPLPARLFAIIDTLDAMTSNRPYRQGLDFDTAKNEIVKMSGSQFDPVAVEIFLAEEERLREMASLHCVIPFHAPASATTSRDGSGLE